MLQFGISRRGFVYAAGSGALATCVPRLTKANSQTGFAAPGFGRAKSVILVHLSGGPSQLETFDLKPQAPAEIRGEFQPIDSLTPGLMLSEHLPNLAQRSNLFTVVRSMAHKEHNHLLATHEVLTGRPTPFPRGGSDLDRVETRDDFPNYAAALDFIQPRSDGLPTGVSLPNYFIEGPLTWPGQHAGFLGVRHDPWSINQDPNDENFKVDSLTLRDGLSKGRLSSRRELLDHLEEAPRSAPHLAFNEQQEVAFSLLTSGKVNSAFEMSQESVETRERYGRNKFGQSLLLSRRLVEAGVPFVQAAMGIVQTWDTHVDNWGRMKNTLLPQLDKGLGALFDDLRDCGRLDETLVIVMGEFGRTPRVSTLPGQTIPGRDHWAHVYSALFAGAGVHGGHLVGESDDIAAYPLTRTWGPGDICSTIFNALGVHADMEVHDRVGRPYKLLNGHVMTPLYTGETA